MESVQLKAERLQEQVIQGRDADQLCFGGGGGGVCVLGSPPHVSVADWSNAVQMKDYNQAKQARELAEEKAREMEELKDKVLDQRDGDKALLQKKEQECQQLRNEKEELNLKKANESKGESRGRLAPAQCLSL
jgi:hypothetical protein|eukprot:COSAG01_NODE_3380_length_6171_cov_10.687582_10_plen_133_part_00